MSIFTRAWWEAVGARMADTALAAALPLAALLFTREVTPWHVVSLVAVQVLAVLGTALFGLPEVAGKSVPLWRAVVVRTAKTLGQSIATALVGVELIEAVDWQAAGVLVAGATLYTLLRTLRDWLPETASPAIIGTVTADGGFTVPAGIETDVMPGGTIRNPGWSTHAFDPANIPGAVIDDEPGRHRA